MLPLDVSTIHTHQFSFEDLVAERRCQMWHTLGTVLALTPSAGAQKAARSRLRISRALCYSLRRVSVRVRVTSELHGLRRQDAERLPNT